MDYIVHCTALHFTFTVTDLGGLWAAHLNSVPSFDDINLQSQTLYKAITNGFRSIAICLVLKIAIPKSLTFPLLKIYC